MERKTSFTLDLAAIWFQTASKESHGRKQRERPWHPQPGEWEQDEVFYLLAEAEEDGSLHERRTSYPYRDGRTATMRIYQIDYTGYAYHTDPDGELHQDTRKVAISWGEYIALGRPRVLTVQETHTLRSPTDDELEKHFDRSHVKTHST